VKSLIDLAWNYHTERAKFSLYGEFNYADLFNSELASAAFNPVNPNLPTTPETGRISLSGNRVLATVYPKFQFEFTPRLSFVAVGTYQDDTYNGVLTDEYVSYDYYDGTIGLDWSINPRSDISAGVGGSKQSARDVYSVTDGRDANVTYNYQWSPTFTGKLSLVAQHDQVTSEPQTGVGNASTSPVRFANTANGIGVQYQTLWTGQISSIQLTVGRTFTPNGSGGSFRSDAFQGEYKRQFTARLSFDGAARYIRNVALSDAYAYGDYDYVVATADLRWNLTPTWYVGGGVQYLNDRYPQYDASATNAMAHVTFGYEALGRQY
jgi:hypothetical protein